MNPDQNQPSPEQPVQPASEPEQPAQPEVKPSPAEPVNPSNPASTPVPPVAPVAPVQQPQQFGQPQPMMQPVAPVAHKSSALAITSLVLGIIGFFTAFIGVGILLGLIAIILGVVSLAKHAGGKGMAIAGLILGALTFVAGGILLAITMTAYNGIQERAVSSSNSSYAAMVVKKAEAYNALNGTLDADKYPTYNELTAATDEAQLDPESRLKLHEGGIDSVSENLPLAYKGCSEGATVYYWDATTGAGKEVSFVAGSPDEC